MTGNLAKFSKKIAVNADECHANGNNAFLSEIEQI